MTNTQTFYRKADISKAEAIGALLDRHEGAEIVSVNTKRATPGEARTAGVRPGDRVYEATIKIAEGNPFGDKSDEPDLTKDKPESKPESKDDGGSEDKSDSDSEPKDEGDAPDDGLGLDDGLGDAPELSDVDKIVNAIQGLTDAISGGGDVPGLDGADPGAGPDAGLGPDPALPPAGDPSVLPDIGAPAAGGAPLPPPVPEKRPAAFASVTQRVASSGEATLVRRDVTGEVTTTELIREAQADFPTHRVAKIIRNGVVKIKGVDVDLPANKVALVTLVRK